MAATATASSTIHYAPEDPTLPKPWKGLVDGKTGFVYYWNPETNVTQYEKPASSSPPAGPSPPRKSLSSSVHVHKESQGKHVGGGGFNDDRYDGVGNGGTTKLSSRAQTHQAIRSGSHHDRDLPNGKVDDGATKGDVSTGAGSGLSIEAYRRRHEITVTGDDVPPPFISFDMTKFPNEILREVQNAGFSAPTPIQAQSWPVALQGRDIVAIAKTGSGKTLGYLIPGFLHLQRKRNNSRMGPTVLVLSPTRELATQIQVEAIKFGKSSRISCTCLYGGAPKGPQLREVDRGVDVVVATPGRLNDILEMRRIRLDQVSYLVLDEADRMLDMGFEPQIRKIVNEVPARRQTLMYTATWPKEVRKIAADLLVNPIQVNIGNVDELVANKSITQYVERVSPMEKQRRLEQILRSQEPGSKVIIFCTTKKMCDQLARNLSRQFGAAAIHGDKSQGDRDYVLNQFRSGRNLVLVATDVAARGLDIKDIRVVINYDFPTGIEDYVHRIGRTGRAGATGVAYTFFCDQDAKHASDLVKVLEGANQKVPVEIRDMASRGSGMAGGRFNNKRQWGTAFGGRDNNARGGRGSDYNNGRDGERTRWTSLPSSERGGRGGYDRNPQQSDKFVRKPHDVDGPASVRNHFETLSRPGAEKRIRSRSRSRSRSRDKGPLWGDKRIRAHSRSRSRSPSNVKLDKPLAAAASRDRPMRRTFHDHIIPPQDRSPPHGNQLHLPKPKEYPRLPSPADNNRQDRGRSPAKLGSGGLSSRIEDEEEEEEEGMIPEDE